jgi:hypothetical protein
VVEAPEARLEGLQAIEERLGLPPPPPAPDLKAAICARYMSARVKVNVAATGPAVAWIVSSVAMSMLLRVARRVNPVPALIVPKRPESSIATPKIRSPFDVVVAAVLVTPLAAVVPPA